MCGDSKLQPGRVENCGISDAASPPCASIASLISFNFPPSCTFLAGSPRVTLFHPLTTSHPVIPLHALMLAHQPPTFSDH